MLDVFLNYACQAKCPFCFNPELTPELIRWKLDLKTVARRLLEGRKEGFAGVTFSGGEVTLLKELPAMLLAAKKSGYEKIGIISNGLLMSDTAYLDSLLAAGLNFVCLSIHGSTAALHDKLVRVPGAFEKLTTLLDRLEIPLMLNFVMTKENYKDAPAFVARFKDRALEIQLYFPHYEGLMHAGLGVSIADGMKVARRALEAADNVFIYNVPPCVAPELTSRMRNWQQDDDLLIDPQESNVGRARYRVGCELCSLKGSCLGFEAKYVEIFGARELQPIR